MKKKWMSGILAACTAAATIAGSGCIPVMADDPDEVTVRFMCFGTVPTDLEMVQDAINEITVPEINVKVNYESISAANYSTQLALDMTSGEKVDVFYNFDFTNSVMNNQLLDLTELLPEYAPDLIDATTEKWLEATTVDGKIYGVPIVNGKAASLCVAMRKDILEKYNIDVNLETSEDITDDSADITLEELSRIYGIVKENELEMIDLCMGGVGTLNLEQMINYDNLTDMTGVLMGNEGYEVVDLYETDQFKKVINTLRDWYLAGYIKSDIATDTESYLSYASAGRMFSVMLATDETIANQLQRDSGYEYIAYRIKTPLITSNTLNGNCWSVSSTTDVPEAAVKFLNLAYSNKDLANLMCYGVEGTHWEYQEDGTVTYPEGVDSTTSGYPMTTYWEMPNSLVASVTAGNDPGYNEQLIQENKEAKTSRALGFSFDSSSVQTEISAISAVGSQYMTGFLTGSMDIDENYDKFIADLKSAGIDTVIAEKQRQLDEWCEEQGITE